ncbi:conserved hypothetical protein [Azospirillaceae bacterium]
MRFLRFFTIAVLLSQVALGDCDWTRITKNGDGTFTYSKELHVCVGTLVQDNKAKITQVEELNKALSMKDLALEVADKRTQNWMDTSTKLEDRVQKIDSLEKKNELVYFGFGVLTAVAAGWMAAKIIGR